MSNSTPDTLNQLETNTLSFDDWKATLPVKTDEEIGDIEYPSEEEEENLDTSFMLEDWEEKYYDEDGNFIEDPDQEAEDVV